MGFFVGFKIFNRVLLQFREHLPHLGAQCPLHLLWHHSKQGSHVLAMPGSSLPDFGCPSLTSPLPLGRNEQSGRQKCVDATCTHVLLLTGPCPTSCGGGKLPPCCRVRARGMQSARSCWLGSEATREDVFGDLLLSNVGQKGQQWPPSRAIP